MKVRVWMLRDDEQTYVVDALRANAHAVEMFDRRVRRGLNAKPPSFVTSVDVEIPDEQIDAAFAAEGAQHDG